MLSLVLVAPLALLSSAGVFAITGPIGPVTDLHIANTVVSPDGFPREAITTEGQLPGPLITGYKGDNFQINVINNLTDETLNTSTSIHWHGFFQHGTNWADGAAYVTQCPIVTGNSFLYNFTVPDQAGTFWYHSHLALQYCDGLRGPLVVYDPHDPYADMYDVDNASTVITLADWYHQPADTIKPPHLASATLINGLGRYVGGPASPLTVITVEQGKRYRFRLVSMACDPSYDFSIDGHDMTIIEVDGVNSKPLTVDEIQIFAAQRYSFILNATRPVGNYWIRAQPNAQQLLVGYIGGINSAILRYIGAPDIDPITVKTPSIKPLQEVNLHPLIDPAAPGKPTPDGANVVIPLNLSIANGQFLINGTTFAPPTTPVLLQIPSGAKPAQKLLPPGSVYTLPKNSTIEIIIPPGTAPGGPHPFHLHGHTFSVVRSAGSSVYNYANPVRRDTVSIGTGKNDAVTIRFTTDNPGPWFIHCHIDFHLNAGLAVVMAEDIPDVASANPVPTAWDQLCPIYDQKVLGQN
uniref:laccase n=1 Tax=Phlebia brevispora TaxID=194682 RepID=J3S8K6_9APHY|nr:laccase [Phlebia brevispora]